MKRYVIATGIVFSLLTLAHVWRAIVEPYVARDPWFIATTILSTAFAVAAWRLARRSSAA